MTYPQVEVMQALLESVRCDDKLAAFDRVIRPFFREKPGYKDDEALLLLVATISDANGTLNRTRTGILETRRRKGKSAQVVSEETLARALRDFGRPGGAT